MMKRQSLSPATHIDTEANLRHLAEFLSDAPLVAIDTESNSLYAYQERVCLIQLSTRAEDFIIDPLAIEDMSPLAPIFESPVIEKVFHAAEYDIICLKRDFGFRFNHLFDTMAAARICGIKAIGLSNLLLEYAGIALDKSHQRDDWGKRPLSPDSLKYAQMDTHYLPLLRDELHQIISAQNHWQEAQEVFIELCNTPASTARDIDPDGFWNIGRPYSLSRREMSILRELYLLREDIAQSEDKPPFKVLDNRTLVRLARKAPTSPRDLQHLKGIGNGRFTRSKKDILKAIKRGKTSECPSLPPPPEIPDPAVVERYAALQTWRKERAVQRGVESDIIMSKHVLWDIAHKAPTTLDDLRLTSGLGAWRFNTYGEEILAVLEQCAVPES